MNRKNFEARRREISNVGHKISSLDELNRRLSETETFLQVEKRALRYNELMKKEETTRRRSLGIDDSSDQRIDRTVDGKREPSISSSLPDLKRARRSSMPIISITEPDDDVLGGLGDLGVLNIEEAGVGPSSIDHNRRASM